MSSNRKQQSAEVTKKDRLLREDEIAKEIFAINPSAKDFESLQKIRATMTHLVHNFGTKFEAPFDTAGDPLIKSIMVKQGLLESQYKALMSSLKSRVEESPFPPPARPSFTFIDLFAGVGGFRIAMQNLGGKCVFSSEWDRFASLTYSVNYGEVPFGDITSPSTKKLIPDGFDVLCAGFPCQAFSIAGKRGGFEDTRGTMFHHIAEILEQRKPKAFFLENVKGLENHKSGDQHTLAIILRKLRSGLKGVNYIVPTPQILNAKDFGVPQNRERIFIVGFREDLGVSETNFSYPEGEETTLRIKDILESEEVAAKYFLSAQYVKTLERHKARHESRGNGFGYAVLDDRDIAGAIVVGGMGRERNLYKDKLPKEQKLTTPKTGGLNKDGIRTLTPREWARLQGFPEEFRIPVSDVQAYKQFGNSVAVPAIQATAKEILKRLKVKPS